MNLLKVSLKAIKKISKCLWQKIKEADEKAYFIDKRLTEMKMKAREKYYLHNDGRWSL